MKMKNITKWLAVSAVFGLLSLATERADAVLEMSYTTDSANLLGTVIPGQLSPPGQAARDAAMTNALLAMASQTQFADPNGSLYSRTTWPGGGPATTVGAVTLTGYSGGTGNVTIDLSNNGYGAFTYLVAAYDGQNGGVAVFNISGITTSVTVYGFAKPEVVNGQLTGNLLGSSTAQQGYFRLTTITLLNPEGGFVPDGGTTVMLLGAALGALGMVRRYLFS
jgi:protein with PEP-CTERM/exosortase system signal